MPNIQAFLWIIYGLLALGFFLAAVLTDDPQKKQTRLLYAIWFAVAEAAKTLNAIAFHTGTYPLWK